MLFENIFMIRGGAFGTDFGIKLIFSIINILICIYDCKTNDKRLDYFWVFLTATLILIMGELLWQTFGIRVIREKYLFGINITTWLWLTIPLQAISEGALMAIIGIFFGDRIMNEETRKKWIVVLILFIVLRFFLPTIVLVSMGFNYANVNVGDPNIPSRRNIFAIGTLITLSLFGSIAILWLIRTDSETRKRGLFLILVALIVSIFWTLGEWIPGQRWVEVGTQNPDGTYSNLRSADPLLEFGILAYDIVIEMVLLYVSFLAIPYLLKLIKSEKKESEKIKFYSKIYK